FQPHHLLLNLSQDFPKFDNWSARFLNWKPVSILTCPNNNFLSSLLRTLRYFYSFQYCFFLSIFSNTLPARHLPPRPATPKFFSPNGTTYPLRVVLTP